MRVTAKPQIMVVEYPNVVDYQCDVLVLKYAQGFYGADEAVASLLTSRDDKKPNIEPASGKFSLVASRGSVAAREVLFVGVVTLSSFGYKQIREFARRALRILGEERPEAEHIAMTIHGVGYGLDERESFLAEVGGLWDALDQGTAPRTLRRITIVERNPDRCERLQRILEEVAEPPETLGVFSPGFSQKPSLPSSIDAGVTSASKAHVFVAMPFVKEMDDVYVLGIQEMVNKAGYLCERLDKTPFLGDILNRIKARIETASLIIADLTGANANVYLEVGYAWGKGRPTLFIAKEGEELKFDVRNHRCVKYESILHLRKQLEEELAELPGWTNQEKT